jgi:hypothetical protein
MDDPKHVVAAGYDAMGPSVRRVAEGSRRIPADALPRQAPRPAAATTGCAGTRVRGGGRVDACLGRARAVDGRRYLGGAARARARSAGEIHLCGPLLDPVQPGLAATASTSRKFVLAKRAPAGDPISILVDPSPTVRRRRRLGVPSKTRRRQRLAHQPGGSEFSAERARRGEPFSRTGFAAVPGAVSPGLPPSSAVRGRILRSVFG